MRQAAVRAGIQRGVLQLISDTHVVGHDVLSGPVFGRLVAPYRGELHAHCYRGPAGRDELAS